MLLKIAITVGAVLLAGCAMTPEPAVIFDVGEDKAVIQARIGTIAPGDASATTRADIDARAREACALYGREPRPISEYQVEDHRRLLFACVKPAS